MIVEVATQKNSEKPFMAESSGALRVGKILHPKTLCPKKYRRLVEQIGDRERSAGLGS